MATRLVRTRLVGLLAAALTSSALTSSALTSTALAQPGMTVDRGGPDAPQGGGSGVQLPEETLRRLVPTDPSDPSMKPVLEWNKRRVAVARQLKVIRLKHFRSIRNTEIRQAGIMKMRAFTDAPAFPAMLEVFEGEGRDVELAVLDHFMDQKSEQGDASLAWAAVFGRDADFRTAAVDRLQRRYRGGGEVSRRVKSIIAEGLEPRHNLSVIEAAAQAASILRLYEAIPMLIQAQAAASGSGGGGDGNRPALAYIYIGTQRSFIADLIPVVGDNAVGFDPVTGVITEGTVLRVTDAFVTIISTAINSSLVALANSGWNGASTASLGYDRAAWRKWYQHDFLPYRWEVEEKARQAAEFIGPPSELAGA